MERSLKRMKVQDGKIPANACLYKFTKNTNVGQNQFLKFDMGKID